MPIDEGIRDAAERSGAPRTFFASLARQERDLAAPFEARVEHHMHEIALLDERADALETGSPALRHLKDELAQHEAEAAAARASAEAHRSRERDALEAMTLVTKKRSTR